MAPYSTAWRTVLGTEDDNAAARRLYEDAGSVAEPFVRRLNEHLDASAGVDGIEAFYEKCIAAGVMTLKPLAPTPWGTKDFYVEDPDGDIVSFGGRPT